MTGDLSRFREGQARTEPGVGFINEIVVMLGAGLALVN
jgi:hypothetical protein